MTKSMLFFIAVLIVMLGAGPALAQDREYVGKTGTTAPNVGIIALHDLCDVAFPGARMCLSGDIVSNGAREGAALPGAVGAWVSPILVVISPDPTFAFDIGGGGTDDSGTLTCEAWSTDTPAARQGLILTANGNLFPASCSTDRPVACCAPRKGKQSGMASGTPGSGVGSGGPALAGEGRQYVGKTVATTLPNVGTIPMHNLCDEEFPGARMCSSADINLNGQAAGSSLAGNPGWVRPTDVRILTPAGDMIYESSGRSGITAGLFSCSAWESDSAAKRGLVIDAFGGFSVQQCNGAQRVACCALRKGKQ